MRNTIDVSKLDLNETIVSIRRVAKTVKGGRNMRFSVTVVVGDGDGHVGKRGSVYFIVRVFLCGYEFVRQIIRRSAVGSEKLFPQSGCGRRCSGNLDPQSSGVRIPEKESAAADPALDARHNWHSVQFLRGRSSGDVRCVHVKQALAVFRHYLFGAVPEGKSG